jgi:hypothetical protein
MAKCDCIFCKLKCSKCGAKDIKVTYSPVFTLRNISEDFITALRETDMLELECTECDAWIEPDCELEKVLNGRLGIPSSAIFKHKDNGKIETVQSRLVSEE